MDVFLNVLMMAKYCLEDRLSGWLNVVLHSIYHLFPNSITYILLLDIYDKFPSKNKYFKKIQNRAIYIYFRIKI